jgi:hypothetical protein
MRNYFKQGDMMRFIGNINIFGERGKGTNYGLKINQIYKVNMAKFKKIRKTNVQLLYIKRDENTNLLIEVAAGCFRLAKGGVAYEKATME